MSDVKRACLSLLYVFILTVTSFAVLSTSGVYSGLGAVDPVTNAYTASSIIDQFTFSMLDPMTGIAIGNGATVSLRNVTVSGTSDPGANVTVAAQSGTYEAVANATGVFELRDVLLIDGLNILTITTTNNASVSASGLMIVTADTICNLRVDPFKSPTNSVGAVFNGTTEPGAVLMVDGLQVDVSSDGSWQAEVSLVEGLNAIHFNATDSVGNQAGLAAFVLLDTTPPELMVSAPTGGTIVSQPVVTLHGTVEQDASISIQGAFVIELETSLSNWTARVALVNGTNAITVIATDAVGNSIQRTVVLVYTPPPVITPDELRKALDGLNDSLRQEINDAQDFASLVMFIALILFMIAVLFTGALWYVLSKRVKGFAESESEHSLEEIEEENPKDVEQEFEDLEKEIRRDDNQRPP